MHIMTKLAAVLGVGVGVLAVTPVLAAPVLAGDPAPQTAPVAPAAPGKADIAKSEIDKTDPIICERVTEIGSRLRAKKICMTKSEWAEQRRGDRSNIERSQIQRGMDPVG